MKIALLTDIHANSAALDTVARSIDDWQPDLVIVAGDIINRGPRPRECLEYILDRQARDGWRVIRGNHERYVLDLASDPTDRPGLDGDVRQSVRWTLAQIDTNGNVDAIAALPEQLVLEGPAGSMIRVVHATMRHDRDNLIASTSDAELREMVDLQAQLFCCGHTHRPLIRQIDQTLVVNAGSVGLPFDNDPRAGYAQIQWLEGGWRAEMIRLHYDRVRALRDMTTSGMLATCGATAQVIQAEIEDAHPYIARWVTTYDQAVIDGVMSAVESVPVFFREHRAAVRATEEPPVLYPHHAS